MLQPWDRSLWHTFWGGMLKSHWGAEIKRGRKLSNSHCLILPSNKELHPLEYLHTLGSLSPGNPTVFEFLQAVYICSFSWFLCHRSDPCTLKVAEGNLTNILSNNRTSKLQMAPFELLPVSPQFLSLLYLWKCNPKGCVESTPNILTWKSIPVIWGNHLSLPHSRTPAKWNNSICLFCPVF